MAEQGRNPRDRKLWYPGHAAPTAERQRGVSCDGLAGSSALEPPQPGWRPTSRMQGCGAKLICPDNDRKALNRAPGPLGAKLMHKKLNK